MKTSLSHLPEAMQADLRKIQAELIPRYAEIGMIILFSSYARGDWKLTSHVGSSRQNDPFLVQFLYFFFP